MLRLDRAYESIFFFFFLKEKKKNKTKQNKTPKPAKTFIKTALTLLTNLWRTDK